jgi:hypothetical protein
MAESCTHIRLVSELVCWITEEYFQGQRGTLLVDAPESPAAAKPFEIAGFVADVIGRKLPGDAVVIGEAKTAKDLESLHTRKQLEVFLRYCAERPGSTFVIAVPWHMTRFARALLKNIKRLSQCDGVSIVVLERLGG